jgi:hypothetical protein
MPNNYILLQQIILSQSAASVTFDNLPTSGYTDLKIVTSARGDSANVYNYCRIRFNGDTGSNYNMQILYGDNGVAGSTPASGTSITGGLYAGSSSTTNTFSNSEWYIPNYRGSTQKSLSIDAVSENNSSTSSNGYLTAASWTGTAAITSATLLPNSGNFVANSTFSLYGVAALGTTPTVAPKAYGGNIITNDGTYWIHTFTSSGIFTPQTTLTCDYLVVAGGGGGGRDLAGGGGAGGFRTGSGFSVASLTDYAITVGAGGLGSTTTPATSASDGNNSIFSTVTSTGGGGGGSNFGVGRTGGSGGGGSRNAAGGAGNTPSTSPSQGNNGGTASQGSTYVSAGGGGASAMGGGGTATVGGAGGNGTASSISGTSVTYAGGGGGAVFSGTAGGAGGAGGGGTGGESGTEGTAGTVNTGGGGGGGNNIGALNGKNGGSGIVIIRYPIA